MLNALELGYNMPGETMAVSLPQTTLGIQMTLRSKGLPLDDDMLHRFDPERLRTDGVFTGLSSFLIWNLVDSA